MTAVTELAAITTIPEQSQHHEMRLSVIEFGRVGIFVDLRVFKDALATHHGVRIAVHNIPQLIEKLRKAREVALDIIESRRGKK